MKTLEEIQSDIESVAAQIRPLAERLESLRRTERQLKSERWIAANEVTRDQVQLSSGDGMPWHGTFMEFGEWLKKANCPKRWCEWNGRIYSTAEAIAGRMASDAPGYLDDIPVALATDPE